MFAKSVLIATLSFVAATTAMAGEATPDFTKDFVSTLTRAEVREAALQAGGAHGGDRSVFAEPTGVAKTRAQVVAETLEAIRLGATGHGERNTVITDAQLEQIRMAGLKALPMNVAMR